MYGWGLRCVSRTLEDHGFRGERSNLWIGGTPSDAGGLILFGWSRDGGDLRAAQFFATHAMHAIPLAALACGRLFGPTAQAPVRFAALAYVGLVAFVFFQALRGVPLIAN